MISFELYIGRFESNFETCSFNKTVSFIYLRDCTTSTSNLEFLAQEEHKNIPQTAAESSKVLDGSHPMDFCSAVFSFFEELQEVRDMQFKHLEAWNHREK